MMVLEVHALRKAKGSVGGAKLEINAFVEL
jgi:hypothetical protein